MNYNKECIMPVDNKTAKKPSKSKISEPPKQEQPKLTGSVAQSLMFFMKHDTLAVPAKLTSVHHQLCLLLAQAIQTDPQENPPNFL